MRKYFFVVVAVLIALQAAAIVLLWGRPEQRVQRSYTPTPEPRLPTAVPAPTRTPLPILRPAALPTASGSVTLASFAVGECRVTALDLIGAWVKSGKPESESFDFQSLDEQDCQASFEDDVLPLFTQPNLWYAGAIACDTCHGQNLDLASARMDLTGYAGLVAGSRREKADSTGNDILGDTNSWEKSKLYQVIITRFMPLGRPPDSPDKGPVVSVGKIK